MSLTTLCTICPFLQHQGNVEGPGWKWIVDRPKTGRPLNAKTVYVKRQIFIQFSLVPSTIRQKTVHFTPFQKHHILTTHFQYRPLSPDSTAIFVKMYVINLEASELEKIWYKGVKYGSIERKKWLDITVVMHIYLVPL